MCIIIDNDVVHQVLLKPDDVKYAELRAAILHAAVADVRMVYGGHLRVEYFRSRRLRRLLVTLDRAGRANAVSDSAVDSREASIRASTLKCRSNDVHVIALAQVSGVRLLCSEDGALHDDFRNPRLLNKPRGKVYRARRGHRQLLLAQCGPGV